MIGLHEDVLEMFAALEGCWDPNQTSLSYRKNVELDPERKAYKVAHDRRRNQRPEVRAARKLRDHARYLRRIGRAS